jgi:hypothetical protein
MLMDAGNVTHNLSCDAVGCSTFQIVKSTKFSLLNYIGVYQWKEQSIKRQWKYSHIRFYKNVYKTRNEKEYIEMHLSNPLTLNSYFSITQDTVRLLTFANLLVFRFQQQVEC